MGINDALNIGLIILGLITIIGSYYTMYRGFTGTPGSLNWAVVGLGFPIGGGIAGFGIAGLI